MGDAHQLMYGYYWWDGDITKSVCSKFILINSLESQLIGFAGIKMKSFLASRVETCP